MRASTQARLRPLSAFPLHPRLDQRGHFPPALPYCLEGLSSWAESQEDKQRGSHGPRSPCWPTSEPRWKSSPCSAKPAPWARLAQRRRFSKLAACPGVPDSNCARAGGGGGGWRAILHSRDRVLASPPVARASSRMGNRLVGTPRTMTTTGNMTTMTSPGISLFGQPAASRASPTAQEGARVLARARPATGWEAGKPGSERNVGEDG